MAVKQIDLFSFDKSKKKKSVKPVEKKPVALRLNEGEIAYKCFVCNDKPIIYTKIIKLKTCDKCGYYIEVADEKLPEVKEDRRTWIRENLNP